MNSGAALSVRTLLMLAGAAAGGVAAGAEESVLQRGAALYTQHCGICHQAHGRGVPGVFPPLAGSDFLRNHREQAIRAPLEGLTGEITVNGQRYSSAMPLVALRDEEAAAVLTYIFTGFGNDEPEVSVEEVARVRRLTKYPTFESLAAVTDYAPLPAAPDGWELREAGRLPFKPVRLLARPGTSQVLVLGERGDVWSFDPEKGASEQIIAAADYIDPQWGDSMSLGICFDPQGRLCLSGNQADRTASPDESVVTVWRTPPVAPGARPGKPETWLRVRYPRGIGGFNHGVSHLAAGPDGFLYLSSGSRTDGGEPGKIPDHFTGGEVPLTAGLWRIDPAAPEPQPEMIVRGLRNPYGFCWDTQGRLWCTDNGPDANRCEELNLIEPGRHYGFPFQFADVDPPDKAYPYTPEAPAGQIFTRPVLNFGPDAGGKSAAPAATFDPHSCPCGIVQLSGDAWRAEDRGTFLIPRFGNLLQLPADTGFDLLKVKVQPAPGGRMTAEVTRLLAPLARPIDVLVYAPGRVLIAEYSRALTFAGGIAQPGRLLELRVKR